MIKLNLNEKKFDDKIILKDIKLTVNQNEKLHLIGQSGVGKTTLMRILMEVDREFDGIITSDFKNKSATYPERVFMGGISIFKEIKIFTHASDDDIDNALKALKIYDAKNKKASELSTGMRSRTSIIRSVLKDSDVIFLDEPLLGLDDLTKAHAIDFIRTKTNNRAVIYTGETIFDDETQFNLNF